MRRIRPVFAYLVGFFGELVAFYGVLLHGCPGGDLFLFCGCCIMCLGVWMVVARFPVKKEKPHNLSVK